MRICEFCKGPMRKRKTEHENLFAVRRFCGSACVIKARRAGIIAKPFAPSVEAAIKARVRRLEDSTVAGSKLTADDVRSIREMSHLLKFTAKEIAHFKGVSKKTIEAILYNRSWKHVQ